MLSSSTRQLIRQRLDAEQGRIEKDAPARIALVYPSPYHVGMSSLGYQQIYAVIQALPGISCERVFLPDGGDEPGQEIEAPVSYEGLRPLGEFSVIAVSVAYELELAGLCKLLDKSTSSPLREARLDTEPLVIGGGPLTFSNPIPLGAFADAIVMGEAEEIIGPVLAVATSFISKSEKLQALSQLPHVFVPSIHGEVLPAMGRVDDSQLPARSTILTPHTELSNMFLIEAERGCSRGCMYCVMRRSTNGGMRIVEPSVLFDAVPAYAKKVGLVGAAVSDHPKIVEIVREFSGRGLQVGLSSLRPDRLKEPFVEALSQSGYKTLTTALDGPSQRLRDGIERRGRSEHYVAAAEHARKFGMERLKLYLMIGLPGERDEDIDECAGFVAGLSKVIPVSLGVAPFCSKRNTPLDQMPFAGVRIVQQRMARLRAGLRGRAEVRATSARWAWVEYVLAQGGEREGRALWEAVQAGGGFSQYRRAFEALGFAPDGEGYGAAAMPTSPERLKMANRRLRTVPAN
ncbi:MAG: radical SAM protein [Polyangiaceae bacterium]|nr:radical SAM protein [Polyangiaceae bacterium]